MLFIDSTGLIYQGEMRLGDRVATEEEISAWESARQQATLASQQQVQIRALLDMVGCINLPHFKKDWALLESIRLRDGQTTQQAYAQNKVYKGFVDAIQVLSQLGVQL